MLSLAVLGRRERRKVRPATTVGQRRRACIASGGRWQYRVGNVRPEACLPPGVPPALDGSCAGGMEKTTINGVEYCMIPCNRYESGEPIFTGKKNGYAYGVYNVGTGVSTVYRDHLTGKCSRNYEPWTFGGGGGGGD